MSGVLASGRIRGMLASGPIRKAPASGPMSGALASGRIRGAPASGRIGTTFRRAAVGSIPGPASFMRRASAVAALGGRVEPAMTRGVRTHRGRSDRRQEAMNSFHFLIM
jgi:hypothetical protein